MNIQKYLQIDVGIIDASKTNPRTQFPENEIAELAESIKKNGQQVPIVVRAISDKKYELVDGERRLRAHKLAKFKTINAEVREMKDVEVLKYQLMTFLHSKNITPLDEAKSLLNLSKMGLNPEQIAAEVAKDVTHVTRYLRLLKLIPPVMKSFEKGDLPLGHALEICRLQPADQETVFAHAMEDFDEDDQPKSISDVKNFIVTQIHLDLRKIAFSKTDPHLLPKAGACTMCVKRSGFNKDLFNDITQADTCTDPKCFKEKIEMHISAEKLAMKEKDVKVIEIATGYNKPKDHPQSITNRSYKEIKGKPCKHAIMGIAIDGSAIGKSIQICNNKECSQHWGSAESGRSNTGEGKGKAVKQLTPEQVEKARIAKLKEEMQATVEVRVVEELVEILPNHIPTSLFSPKSILVQAAYGMLANGWYNEQEIRKGCKVPPKKKLDKLPPKKLIELINYGAYIQLREEQNEDDVVLSTAKLWKVNVEKIKKEVTKQVVAEYAEKMTPQNLQDDKQETKAGTKSLALPEKEDEEEES